MKSRLIILLLFLCGTALAREDIYVDHIEFQASGSSSVFSNCVYEDQSGFLWIGTSKGLFRHDGYIARNINEYLKEYEISLASYDVVSIIEDNHNRLWLATNRGLYIYDRIAEKMTHIVDSISERENCRILYLLSDQEVAVGTNSGLYIYDMNLRFVERYHVDGELNTTLSHNIVRSIYADNRGLMWIGTFDGLNILNRTQGAISHLRIKSPLLRDSRNNLILSIQPLDEDDDSILAIGTETGLAIYNTADGSYETKTHDVNNKLLSSNTVKSICLDGDKLWYGTDYGLNVYNIKSDTIESYFHDHTNMTSLSNDVIWHVCKGRNGSIWLATEGGVDLSYKTPASEGRGRLSLDMRPLRGGAIVDHASILGNNDVYYATNSGVIKYNAKSKEYAQIRTHDLLHARTNSVIPGFDGRIWIATLGGLGILDEKSGVIESYTSLDYSDGKSSNYINKIIRGNNSDMWMSVYAGGLYRVTRDQAGDLNFKNYKFNRDIDNNIVDFEIDPNNNLWIGTFDGISFFNVITGDLDYIPLLARDSDLDRYVRLTKISIDQLNRVWCSTNNGLYLLNQKKKLFERYRSESITGRTSNVIGLSESQIICICGDAILIVDGDRVVKVPNKDLGLNSVHHITMIDDQRVAVVGNAGVSSFVVDDYLVDNQTDVNIHFSSLRVHNESVVVGDKGERRNPILDKSIDHVDQIVLDYDENVITLGLTSLDYGSMDGVRYQYLLEGATTQWVSTDPGVPQISLNYLNFGNYRLRIRSYNRYGEFSNEEKVLGIIINPPFYLSKVAIIIYSLIIITILLLLRNIFVHREREKNEAKYQQLQVAKSEELIEVKFKFFTNISHELKTPLSLISGPIDHLLNDSELPESAQTTLRLAKRNTDRLKRLVNQILDFRRVEKGVEKLNVQYYNIVAFCFNIATLFREESENQGVTVKFESSAERIYIWFDKDKIEKILFNLLSNSLKFTPDGGEIIVSISYHDLNHIEISVTDSGCGIEPTFLPYVFDRYNTSYPHSPVLQPGSGIGLSVVKDYVKMHNGDINVESSVGIGSKFTFTLPLLKKMLGDYEEVSAEEDSEEAIVVEEQTPIPIVPQAAPDDREKVLVVEDSYDMREFIRSTLAKHYNVSVAKDGVEGLAMAKLHLPDLIVSDLMMPNMDGIELCKSVKSDKQLDHIPMILLTAKSDIASQMEGLKVGADDYIAKPFDMDYLFARIKNLIKQRALMKKYYQLRGNLEPVDVSTLNTEDRLIDEVNMAIEREIGNDKLNVAYLSDALNMSSVNLYRKIKSATGQTAAEYIRSRRLMRAEQLLKKGVLNVSEVMFMVGFTNRSYFTRSFKEKYGVLPKQYKKDENN